MPQDFCVHKCYSCNMYQVHVVKKNSNKWTCKMCGEKQSVNKVFGQGSAKDCREHVQRLNLLKGMSAEPAERETNEQGNQNRKRKLHSLSNDDCRHVPETRTCSDVPLMKVSKWECFLSSDSDIE
ncbi:MRN complex-interacting protein-like [Daphnia carinata]|uniref:MRN complex-interacting protein-like n=1 Tax=Daphnia carinata TaxID=120202 RepID=UPI00257AA9FD|nr:MRN complex-interacting protein-like [Daphnia carinata]